MIPSVKTILLFLLLSGCSLSGPYHYYRIADNSVALCYSGSGSKFAVYKGFYKKAAEMAKLRSYNNFDTTLFPPDEHKAFVKKRRLCGQRKRWTILRKVEFYKDQNKPQSSISVTNFLGRVDSCNDLTCILKLIDSAVE